ncbi:MAG: ABC transporter ATP-binding protein [Bacteroidetes bacterium]|nr:ABC transporter ATP-binding protein [Bacteroidota bacterium]
MIEVRNIKKSYGPLEVLKGINLSINKGEIVSIVGASGAGKTTLLQILGTLDNADSGQLFINDTEVSSLKGKKIAKFRNQNIGFVFQFHHLLPEFTALENVCIPYYINNGNKKEAETKAMKLLEILGVGARANHKPNELSGGEQQRVAVARALINDPAIVLADEPSGNLDSATANNLHQLFFKLREEFNQTFIIVTHNEELAAMADRKIVMRDGNVLNDFNA